eukprot:COSAG02_NODE_5714_length_4100_cov_9.621939_2_plen_71_part_00
MSTEHGNRQHYCIGEHTLEGLLNKLGGHNSEALNLVSKADLASWNGPTFRPTPLKTFKTSVEDGCLGAPP